jgi:chaperonin GroEL (HSP60 family)
VVPRTIAENSGLQATEVLARLYAAHTQGQVRARDCSAQALTGVCCTALGVLCLRLVCAAL